MSIPSIFRAAFLLLLISGTGLVAEEAKLTVTPATIVLQGQAARQQVIVTEELGGTLADITRKVQFSVPADTSAMVAPSGVVHALQDGSTELKIEYAGRTLTVPVQVAGTAEAIPVSFELDVIPILTKLGCNAGACHGKSRGQNGFQLSLLGFYPDLDYGALTKEARGRRVFPPAPESSLLLRKGSGEVPHGGGKRFDVGDANYEVLRQWVAQGLPRKQDDDPVLERVSVFPTERVLKNLDDQQLLVTAYYSDGTTRDVTGLAAYQSNESAVVGVDIGGLVNAGPLPGEAAIMARYMGQLATCHVMIPQPGTVDPEVYAQLPRNNFIDEHVWNKLQRLAITPSEAADDATFLRRVSLDIIGRLPSSDEARAFLADTATDKRTKLIDSLLARPEYGDHWANKWADLLRPNPYRVGIKAVFNLDAWLRDAFRRNMPYDQFVREIISAQGSTWHNGATTLFRDRRTPDELTTIVSQLFLGIRLECAKCHHHPFETYGQEDFYSFAAYFARVGRKGTGISPPISGGEEIVFTASKGQVTHPLSGEVLEPKPLFGKAPEVTEDSDPREALAAWVTSDDNHFFAQVMVNRVWADIMGRGLVDPVDDLRGTNPPTNGPLLEALAEDFRNQGYDIKKLIRTITTSYVYGLSSLPSERNAADTRNYSRHYRQRLRAEVLLDAACDITEVPETFAALPPGSRATQIWTHRVASVFLDSFGRPDPNQDPPCERTGETTIVQTLHLMNAQGLHQKVISPAGRVAELAKSEKTPAEIVTELYLLVYSRFPDDEELRYGTSLFDAEGTTRNIAAEDLLWALMNTPEFVFKN